MTAAENLITQNLDIWASALKQKSVAGRGSSKKIELYGIKKLRELILELAVRGLLVPQDPTDEPSIELLKKIAAEKSRLVTEGRIKKEKPLPPIEDEKTPHPLPKGWIWERFGNLAEHNAGKTLDKGRNQGTPRDYITTSNLYWGFFELNGVKQMPIQNSDLEKCLATKNDLLICEGGEAGRAAVWNHDYDICFQNHIHRARFWQGISPYYAYRLLEKMTYSGEIENYRKGVGISNMSGKALGSIPFPLPPLSEQHRIVTKVDELMALCDQLEQKTEASIGAHQVLVETLLSAMTSAVDHSQFASAWQRLVANFNTLFTTENSLDQLKQTLLQLAVMGKLSPQDPNDEPASELLRRISAEKAKLVKEGEIKKEKPLPPFGDKDKPFELPQGWAWCNLSELVTIRGGKRVSNGYQLLTTPTNFIYIRVSDMKDGSIDDSNLRYIDTQMQSKISQYIITKDDIYMTIVGATIGKCGLVPDKFDRMNLTENAARLTPHLVSKYFLYEILTSDFCQNQFIDKTKQVGVQKMALNRLASTLIPLPPLAEQNRIIAKVDELTMLCDQLKISLNNAKDIQLHLADAMAEKAVKSQP